MKCSPILFLLFFVSLQCVNAQLSNIPPPRDLERTSFHEGVFNAEIVPERTGFTGVCVDCVVEEIDCLVNSDCNRRFGTRFTVTAGAQNTGTIAAVATDTIFPAGTYAGWTHYYEGGILAIGWDAAVGPLALATYLDGEFQEGREVENRNMVTGLGIFTTTETHFVEMPTTKPFNEIQIIVDFGEVSNIEFARIPSIYVGTERSNDALAVGWQNFSAQASEEGVQLDWTLMETDNVQQFIVERLDVHTTDFLAIQTIAATDKNALSAYQFFDKNPSNGRLQYRIKAIEMDGQISYSPVRAIHFTNTNQRPYSLLENPLTQRQLRLNIQEPLALQLIDGQGRVVQKADDQLVGEQVLILENIGAGVYYLQLQTENEYWVEKVIVQ